MKKMIRLIDNDKAVEISICEWDEENSQYGPDWSADFFEVGGLETVEDRSLLTLWMTSITASSMRETWWPVWATLRETRNRISLLT